MPLLGCSEVVAREIAARSCGGSAGGSLVLKRTVAETVTETSLHRFRHSGVRRMREHYET